MTTKQIFLTDTQRRTSTTKIVAQKPPTFDEVICQIRAVTDLLSKHLELMCDLMKLLK